MIERQFADIVWLSKLQPYAGIFDEGHKLKNPKALVYKHLSRLPLQWRLVLTGTPVQNNLKELLSLLSFIEPSLFEGNILEDMNTLFEAKVPNKDVLNFAALAKERVASARTIMVPFILQRRKDEVLELPKKTDRLITLPMTGAQKILYEEIKATYLKGGKRAGSSKDKGNVWQQLRKAAIHPQLFRRHFTDKVVQQMTDILWKKCSAAELNVQEDKPDKHKRIFHESLLDGWDFSLHLWCKEFPRYIGQFDVPDRSWDEAPKVRKLLELVEGYQANGDRCLVFSRYEMVIDILRETFAFAGIEYCELTGRSSVSERFPEIDRFNKRPEIPVFLLTTGAGGTGLNLTAANKIIIFDQSDNPQDDVQASNRAHRIGQTREVEVIHLITENTVEGLIYNSCVKKLMLAASVEGRVSDDETVEEECRRKMLLGDDENIELELPPSQQVILE
jgi:SWI/SNF-related matrix-associated actin-dependent regulator of chromatin subfamily A containing DEAD/H box 1